MKHLLLLFSVFTFSLSAMAQTTNPAIDSAEAKPQKNPRNDALRQRFHQPDYQNNSNSNTVERRGKRLSNHQFFLELQNVKGQYSSGGKRMAAKRLAERYLLTSAQVYNLCNAIGSYARLDLAKFCYTRCTDPENYDIVFDAMPNVQTADLLNDYITNAYQQYPEDDMFPDGENGNYGFPMPAQKFNNAKQTIANTTFESTKLETAKIIVASQHLSTDQVMEICRLFGFESTKLDFAKFAYTHTSDKSNYFKVNDVFDFDSSKSDLNRFIQSGV